MTGPLDLHRSVANGQLDRAAAAYEIGGVCARHGKCGGGCETAHKHRMKLALLAVGEDPRVELFAGMTDGLMAAGDRLAEKLRDIDASPWIEQILAEWQEAKMIHD